MKNASEPCRRHSAKYCANNREIGPCEIWKYSIDGEAFFKAEYNGSDMNLNTGSGTMKKGIDTYAVKGCQPFSVSIIHAPTALTYTFVFEASRTLAANVSIEDNKGNTVVYSVGLEDTPRVKVAKLLVNFDTGTGASTAKNTGKLSHQKLPALIDLYYDEQVAAGNRIKMEELIVSLIRDTQFQTQFLEWAEGKFDQI